MLRLFSAILLSLLLIGISTPIVAMAFDSCATEHCAGGDNGKDSESHGPCDCPVHHHSCCQAQNFVKPQSSWVGRSAGKSRLLPRYFFALSFPVLEGPFQPPKA